MTTRASCSDGRHSQFGAIGSSISQDILRYLNKSPENQAAGDNLKSRLGALLTPQLLCLVFYRVAHFLWVKGWPRMAWVTAYVNAYIHKVNLPPQSCIGPGCFLPHPVGVTFWGSAGCGLTLYSLATCCPSGPLWRATGTAPMLGDRVLVGGHAVVLGAVRVGDDTKIAYSVALREDAPPGVLVVANGMKTLLQTPSAAPAQASDWAADPVATGAPQR